MSPSAGIAAKTRIILQFSAWTRFRVQQSTTDNNMALYAEIPIRETRRALLRKTIVRQFDVAPFLHFNRKRSYSTA